MSIDSISNTSSYLSTYATSSSGNQSSGEELSPLELELQGKLTQRTDLATYQHRASQVRQSITRLVNYLREKRLSQGSDYAGARSSQSVSLSDENAPLATQPGMEGVTAGQIRINGVSIAIDPATDSITDIVQRINRSQEGVFASFNAENGILQISSRLPSQSLTLEDTDGTGFLSAFHLQAGTTAPDRSWNQAAKRLRSTEYQDLFSELIENLDSLLKDRNDTVQGWLDGLRGKMQTIFLNTWPSLSRTSSVLASPLGIKLRTQEPPGDDNEVTWVSFQQTTFLEYARKHPDKVLDFLGVKSNGELRPDGFLSIIDRDLEKTVREATRQNGRVALFLNRFV
ncbi:MAG: hypothetical protein D6820_00525 [Lentisphaerae bacterium]|nr:MAG: hypothetical protein D6820_00525 [Lentisphaerota bacterium]